jgi:hypothetical protein
MNSNDLRNLGRGARVKIQEADGDAWAWFSWAGWGQEQQVYGSHYIMRPELPIQPGPEPRPPRFAVEILAA